MREAFNGHVERTRVVNPEQLRLSFTLLRLFISAGNLENARSKEASRIMRSGNKMKQAPDVESQRVS